MSIYIYIYIYIYVYIYIYIYKIDRKIIKNGFIGRFQNVTFKF